MRSMERLYAVHVVRTMLPMNSGFAVTSVKSGFMGSVLKSHLLELSILSNTSAQIAATKEHAPDPGLWLAPLWNYDESC